MMNSGADLKSCIQSCWECRNECQTTLFTHCLETGGDHLAPEHVRIMADCIQMCQLAADAMVRKSPLHADICRLCADICTACAESCEKIESREMQSCADICRKCADSCREMGGLPGAPHSDAQNEGRIMA